MATKLSSFEYCYAGLDNTALPNKTADKPNNVVKNGLWAIATSYEESEPIAVMRGSVLGSLKEPGEKVRKYRHPKRNDDKDEGSDPESKETANIEPQQKGKVAMPSSDDQSSKLEFKDPR